MVKLCIGVATYKRPKMLGILLQSLKNISIPSNCAVTLIICDNDWEQSAYSIFEKFVSNTSFKSTYINQPLRGLANVRNSIVEDAIFLEADYLAFVDDDETVDKGWLSELYHCMKEFQSDVIVGQVQYHFPEDSNLSETYQKVIYNQDGIQTGDQLDEAATGNVMYKMEIIKKLNLRFDTALNHTGGEDILFSKLIHQSGYKIIRCNEAVTHEWMPKSKSNEAWILKRKYRIGYNEVLIDRMLRGFVVSTVSASFRYFMGKVKLMSHTFGGDQSNQNQYLLEKAWLKGIRDALLKKPYEEYKEIHGD